MKQPTINIDMKDYVAVDIHVEFLRYCNGASTEEELKEAIKFKEADRLNQHR